MKQPFRNYLIALVSILAISYLGFGVEQSDFWPMLFCYGLAFGSYAWVIYRVKTHQQILFFLGLALVLRLILVGAFPFLSDDIYRFIWDGRLIVQGYNPFNQLPSFYLQEGQEVEGLNQVLFDQLNSPNYFTIYPPVCQAIFATACWLFPKSWIGAAVVMKLFMVLFEVGSMALIWKLLAYFQLPIRRILLYALNPLMIIEITGNLHFEGAMIFFLLLSLWFLVRSQWTWSALAMALSVAVKLLPLMFLPLLIQHLGWKRSFRYFLIGGLALLVLFSPLLNEVFLFHFGNSLDLYFRKFEFNASIYYLLRWLGFQLSGYNMIAIIGPGLGLLVLSSILYLSFRKMEANVARLPLQMLLAVSIYLACTTTVHPWYTALPLVCCIFTPLRYPVWWTGLIFLTYVNYSYDPYWENLYFVALEYLVLATLLYREYSQQQTLLSA
ncbi:MAG: hypothetical protein AAFP19_02835 [Bacteroidota bacterium]